MGLLPTFQREGGHPFAFAAQRNVPPTQVSFSMRVAQLTEVFREPRLEHLRSRTVERPDVTFAVWTHAS